MDARSIFGLGLFFLVATSASVAHAQVPTAITLSGTLGTTIGKAGTNYNITGGTRNGGNLFHSFGLFNVGTGDTANFFNETGLATSNILGRVTGGQTSNILGTIRTTNFGAANLFLINPAGWVFGPTASLDVGGSFHISTADYLKFSQNEKFYADLSKDSILSSAPVSAFGFLSQNPAGIDVFGSVLQVSVGKTLSLAGGDINIVSDPSSLALPTLSAASGKIQLASVASPGEVPFNLQDTNLTDFGRLGKINLSAAVLDASGDGGGTAIIRGGRLMIDRSAILSQTHGNIDGAVTGVNIKVQEDLSLTDGGLISASTSGAGRGGDVEITANRLIITGGGAIDSSTYSSGSAGNVSITANESIRVSGNTSAAVNSVVTSLAAGGGAGGIIFISTPSLTVDSGLIATTSIGLPVNPALTGNAGSIVLDLGRLFVLNGGTIESTTHSGGSGGQIFLNAADSVLISGFGLSNSGTVVRSVINTATDGFGPAGAIAILTPNVTLDGGGIFSSTLSVGHGGTVDITARTISLAGGASISAASSGSGNAGTINLSATGSLRSRNGTITTQADVADGGNISLNVGKLVDLFNSDVTASVFSQNARGGNIMIDPQAVVLRNHSNIIADAPFTIFAGRVQIQADLFLRSPDSTAAGSGGLSIIAPNANVPQSVAPLPENILQTTSLIRQTCAARLSGIKPSTLMVAARDGLPLEPGSLMASPLYRMETQRAEVLSQRSEVGSQRSAGKQKKEGYELLALSDTILSGNWPCTK